MAHATTSTGLQVIYHEPVCPACGSRNVTRAEVQVSEDFTETALSCRNCGTAWPLACVAEWHVRTPRTPRQEAVALTLQRQGGEP